MMTILSFWSMTVAAANVPTFFEDAWIKQRTKRTHLAYPAPLPAWLHETVAQPTSLPGWNDRWANLTREWAVSLRVGLYLAKLGAERAAELEIAPMLRALGRINAAVRDVTDPVKAEALRHFVVAETVSRVRAEIATEDAEASHRVDDLLQALVARAGSDPEFAKADRAFGTEARVDAFFESARGAAGAGLIGCTLEHVTFGYGSPIDIWVSGASALAGIVFARRKFPPSARRSSVRTVLVPLQHACARRLLDAPLIED